MEFREYLRIVRKRAWIPFILTVLFIAAGWYYNYFILESIYVADAKVYIGKEQGQDNQQALMNSLIEGDKLAKDYRELIKSRKVTELAAKKLNRNDISPTEIANMISVELKTDTRILVINAEATDKNLAYDVANVVADVFKTKVEEFMQRENVSIFDKAVVPQYPSKPNRIFNIFIITLIGFILGVGYLFLMEYFDTSIETPKDIEQHIGLQVLGVIPSFKDSMRRKYYGYY